MKKTVDNFISHNSIFGWIALTTLAALLVPLLAMQFTTEVQWDETDFIVMGVLVFGIASTFVLVARKASCKYRALIGLTFLLAFLYIWAELAVGIFTNLGS